MKRLIILLILLISSVAFADPKIVDLRLTSDLVDGKSGLTGGALSRVSAATYVDLHGDLQTAWGDRDQMIPTADQNIDTNWPLTITVTADTTYTLSTNTAGTFGYNSR